MTRSSIPVRSPSEVLAQGVAAVGYCLIALFLLTLAGNFLPPRLLSPDWQLAVTSNLVDNGAYPLLGVVLVLLASSIDPSNERLSQRQALLRSLACWACIGYLLLAPLQAVVFSRGLNQASIDLGRQVRTTRQAIAEFAEQTLTRIDIENFVELAESDSKGIPYRILTGDSLQPQPTDERRSLGCD